MPITLWGNQFDPFMDLSDHLFSFKVMSDFKLTNITKVQ